MYLKNCSFCGGPAGELHWPGHVGCMDKNCGGYGANLPVAQWNTRPELDRLEKLVEEMRGTMLDLVERIEDDEEHGAGADEVFCDICQSIKTARSLLSRMNKETGE